MIERTDLGQVFKHFAGSVIGDGRLALQVIGPQGIVGRDAVLGLQQNPVVWEFVDNLGFAFRQLLTWCEPCNTQTKDIKWKSTWHNAIYLGDYVSRHSQNSCCLSKVGQSCRDDENPDLL